MENFDIQKNVSLKDYCTFHVGGKAKQLFVARTKDELIRICNYCVLHKIPYKVIGCGSNLLFDDKGYNGMIVVNKTDKIKKYKSSLVVEGGLNLNVLLTHCQKLGLSGLENLTGIPATVGGAIVNNCGAFNTEFGSLVEWVEAFDVCNPNKVIKLNNKSCKFGYRTSIFKEQNYVILRAKLNFCVDTFENIKNKMQTALNTKKSTQPLGEFSAGSVFKRGELLPGKVIDEMNLKLTKIGGAQISGKHANFIINTGKAKSKHIKRLIALIQSKIKDKFNKTLELEIEFVPLLPHKK